MRVLRLATRGSPLALEQARRIRARLTAVHAGLVTELVVVESGGDLRPGTAIQALGGAGVFRPEVTAPYGIKYPVLAWGQGFERLAMLRWNLKDIRELYATDMDTLRQSPIF